MVGGGERGGAGRCSRLICCCWFQACRRHHTTTCPSPCPRLPLQFAKLRHQGCSFLVAGRWCDAADRFLTLADVEVPEMLQRGVRAWRPPAECCCWGLLLRCRPCPRPHGHAQLERKLQLQSPAAAAAPALGCRTALQGLFAEIPASEFRADVSSTVLRAGGGGGAAGP